MGYREYQPHAALRAYIDAYWTVTTGLIDHTFTSRILPDGAVDIICNLGAAVFNAGNEAVLVADKVYLVGTMTAYSDSVIQSDSKLVGIRFKPGAFSIFYRMPLYQTADACIEFERTLLDVGLTGDDFVTKLNGYFLQRMGDVSSPLFPVINSILLHNGTLRIELLAKEHFITQRQLERHFNQAIGVSAKAFSNIVRFRSALPAIKCPPAQLSLEEIAIRYGYYDHAHLAKEIKKYTGVAPSLY